MDDMQTLLGRKDFTEARSIAALYKIRDLLEQKQITASG
jgi:hypothetical protein